MGGKGEGKKGGGKGKGKGEGKGKGIVAGCTAMRRRRRRRRRRRAISGLSSCPATDRQAQGAAAAQELPQPALCCATAPEEPRSSGGRLHPGFGQQGGSLLQRPRRPQSRDGKPHIASYCLCLVWRRRGLMILMGDPKLQIGRPSIVWVLPFVWGFDAACAESTLRAP